MHNNSYKIKAAFLCNENFNNSINELKPFLGFVLNKISAEIDTKSINLIQHRYGAPCMRLFGLGPSLSPIKAIKQLQTLLNKNTSWAQNRSLKHLKKMIAKSSSIVTLWEEKTLIGFGRATSDNIYRAVLWDIVIAKDYQKHGFGKILVDSLKKSESFNFD